MSPKGTFGGDQVSGRDPLEHHGRKARTLNQVEGLLQEMRGLRDECKSLLARCEAAADRTRPIVVGGARPKNERHRVFTDAKKNAYLAHREAGLTPLAAAQAVGVSMGAVAQARLTDAGFVDGERLVDAQKAENAVAHLEQAAAAGDVRAAIWLAERLAPEKYAPKAAEVRISGQIDQTHTLDAAPALERIALLHARLAARALPAGQTDPSDAGFIDVEAEED